MKAVAAKEYRTEEEIRDLVARGQVAVCANKLHKCIDPNGVGSMCGKFRAVRSMNKALAGEYIDIL